MGVCSSKDAEERQNLAIKEAKEAPDIDEGRKASIKKTVLECKKNVAESSEKLEAIWNKYRDDENDTLSERLPEFLRAIELDPDGAESFGFAWAIGHSQLGAITRKDWMEGLQNQGVESWESLLTWSQRLRMKIQNQKTYRSMYMWVFDYVKEESRKTVSREYAEPLWDVLLQPKFPLYDKWTKFMETKFEGKVVKRDLWNCIYDFAIEIGSNLESYDRQSGAWPVVIDEFYDFASMDKKNEGKQDKPTA